MGLPARQHRPDPSFVGREDELAHLDRRLTQAAAGVPYAVLVRGEAGVGKSRLLREFAQRARAADALVLSGSCVPLGAGELPYAPLIDALRRLVREVGEPTLLRLAAQPYADLADLIRDFSDTVPEPVGEPRSQLRIFGAVLRLLDRLGTDRPVLLTLEDLQWADPSTLDLLAYVIPAQTDERVLVVCSYRTGDLPPRHPLRAVVAELALARRVDQLDLVPFTRTELRAFLATLTGAPVAPETAAHVHELSDGNAFFSEELVMAGVIERGDPTAPAVRLPGSLRDLVLTRFELLGDDAREVLRIAAVAGRRVGHRLLAGVCDLPARRMTAALRECVAQHMLLTDPDDDGYLFRHALVREAVYQDLLPGERVELHAAVAAVLTADRRLGRTEDLTFGAQLSYHWYEAGAYAEALAAAVRAGDTAIRVRAFREAELQYRRAVGLWSRVPDPAAVTGTTHVRLLARAADASRWSGRTEQAVELVREALAEIDAADRAQAGELCERLGRYLWEAADTAGSQQAYAAALRCLADEPDSAVSARVLAGQATAEVRAGRYSAGLRIGVRAVELARRVGAKAEEGQALNTVGVARTMTGRVEEGIAALRSALQIAEATDRIEELFRGYGNLMLALEHAGRLEESVRVALEGLDRARRLGLQHTRGGGVLANNAGAVLASLGRWDEATALLADLVEERPVRESLYPRLTLAEIEVGRGRFADAERHLAAVREEGDSLREPKFVASRHACEAECALWRRQFDDVGATVAAGLAAIGDSEQFVLLLRLHALGLRGAADRWLRLSALHRAGSEELARVEAAIVAHRGAVDALVDSPAWSPLPEARALHLLCLAERDRIADAPDPAKWGAAADAWDAFGRPFPAAYARWRQAEAAVVRRDSAVATTAARSAHAAAERLGAEALRAEVESLARRARLDLRAGAAPPPPRRRPADPFGLTAREREVLRLICDGSTNRRIARTLFIAEKTAGVHVSNILMKLGVTSRGEAAAAAHRLGIFDPDDSGPNEGPAP
ncbi:LuxR family transcriptional regulator [Virgisporangium aliadipatigenens]|uniref:LuxR family transcriptional regulator n=1 Tax=Virgisporangium aliadipatigenens TaxID=741659 RepID=A0A8J4DR47_9ACTN|nr:AAA family ATPase [Virgisporangium aliadipatigenens]GIJ45972.1 LuxR family transcriptional regulator [Virgisporangium aliadipatigenens]